LPTGKKAGLENLQPGFLVGSWRPSAFLTEQEEHKYVHHFYQL
jgi:hypothetical protein